MFVENEVGHLMERSLPQFDELLSGIKHSIPIFVVMPDHSSMNTPFKISPVESIRRMAEVRQTEFISNHFQSLIFQLFSIIFISNHLFGSSVPSLLIENPSKFVTIFNIQNCRPVAACFSDRMFSYNDSLTMPRNQAL